MFTSSPQSVEVHQAGTWWAGELLGWRHDASGACQMWVRVVVGGVEETAWIDLAALRLPAAEASASSADPGRIDPRVKQELPPAQAVSALRDRAASRGSTSAALPTSRTGASAAAPSVADPAAATVTAPAVAASTVMAAKPAGRRRAPEQEPAVPAVANAPVLLPTPAAAEVAGSAGRHRAPGDEGRHRAADTEVFAAVSDETDRFATVQAEPLPEKRRATRPRTGATWAVPTARTARPEESIGRSEVCTGRIDAEPDLLTRPMRLSDLAGGPRRPWLSGSVSGA